MDSWYLSTFLGAERSAPLLRWFSLYFTFSFLSPWWWLQRACSKRALNHPIGKVLWREIHELGPLLLLGPDNKRKMISQVCRCVFQDNVRVAVSSWRSGEVNLWHNGFGRRKKRVRAQTLTQGRCCEMSSGEMLTPRHFKKLRLGRMVQNSSFRLCSSDARIPRSTRLKCTAHWGCSIMHKTSFSWSCFVCYYRIHTVFV